MAATIYQMPWNIVNKVFLLDMRPNVKIPHSHDDDDDDGVTFSMIRYAVIK